MLSSRGLSIQEALIDPMHEGIGFTSEVFSCCAGHAGNWTRVSLCSTAPMGSHYTAVSLLGNVSMGVLTSVHWGL